jgi:hypothetical protein
MELYLNGEVSIEEAIANMDTEVNAALRERLDAIS